MNPNDDGNLPVLLIEDEPGVMEFVRTTLERNGYAVVCARSGVEGIELLGSGDFKGVVSDMATPGGVVQVPPVGATVQTTSRRGLGMAV